MDQDTPAIFDLAAYLDCNPNEDAYITDINYKLTPHNHDNFLDELHPRISKRVDNSGIELLTQVNRPTVVMAVHCLQSMGVKDPVMFLAPWPQNRVLSLWNYVDSCIEWDLDFTLGDEQISAFLDKKLYAVSTLKLNWSTVKMIAQESITSTKFISSVCRI